MKNLTRVTAMLFALVGALAAGSAYAHFVPAPCDFITGGGFVFDNDGSRVNFGAHGGCKNGAFWGHVNIVHHGYNPPAHLKSTRITGYLMDPAYPNARDICGEAVIDGGAGSFTAKFRVRMEDNGEPGGLDRFGIWLSNGYVLLARELGPPGRNGGGGNIKLHKPNPSTTGPSPAPTEAQMCPDVAPPEG